MSNTRLTFFCTWLLVFFLPIQLFCQEPVEDKKPTRHAITYEYTAGRFGDKLLGYAQARYLSHLTGLSFLYRPFENSQYLTIEYEAFSLEQHYKAYSQILHIRSPETITEFFKMLRDPQTPPTIFVIDYFASDMSEWEPQGSWWSIALNIPWCDDKFAHYLQSSLQPRIPIPNLTVNGRLNVADHIRTLSGGDVPQGSIRDLPLKHVTLDYHERQIRKIYEWNLKKPMHVFLFSDTKTPLVLLEEMQKRFKTEDIIFNIQILEQPDVKYVIQDFFAMQKFNVIIATQSNFSMMASRLGNFDMIITPLHVIGKYPNYQIDRVQIVTRKSSWFPYDLNIVIREDEKLLEQARAPGNNHWRGICDYFPEINDAEISAK